MKYKLIKWYPSLPKELKVGDEVHLFYSFFYDGYNTLDNKCKHRLSKQEVEDNPEFWEKVVEKEYEILSFYFKNIAGKGDAYVDKDYIWKETSKGSGMWSRDGYITASYSTEEMLQNSNYGIHSVKRLSDGEVFTIGDVVENQKYPWPEYPYKGSITKFKIAPEPYNELRVYYYGSDFINSIKHSKQPLFITEDGVEIFEGDIYHPVLINSLYYQGKYTAETPNCGRFTNPNSCKTFSTKEKAEEYVLYNKPCLSIIDVISVVNTRYSIDDVLKRIVKEKLKKE